MPSYRIKQKVKFADDGSPLKQTKVYVSIHDRFKRAVKRQQYMVDEYGYIKIDLELRWKHPYLRIDVYPFGYDNVTMEYQIKWHCDKPALMLESMDIFRTL